MALRLFIEINDWKWHRTPSVDEAERAVLAIADSTWGQDEMAAWLRDYLIPRSTPQT